MITVFALVEEQKFILSVCMHACYVGMYVTYICTYVCMLFEKSLIANILREYVLKNAYMPVHIWVVLSYWWWILHMEFLFEISCEAFLNDATPQYV